jgi:hypothetical protein
MEVVGVFLVIMMRQSNIYFSSVALPDYMADYPSSFQHTLVGTGPPVPARKGL